MFCSLWVFSQDRTVTKEMNVDATYYKYSGTAADTLGAVDQDTLDLIVVYRGGGYVNKVAVKSRFDLNSGADTTVAISVFGKEFGDDGTYVEVIASALTADINANNTTKIMVSDPYSVEASAIYAVAAGDSTISAHNHTPFDKSYRYYRIRYILTAQSLAGTGVKLDEFEIKFYN